jgi:hypothetical protein
VRHRYFFIESTGLRAADPGGADHVKDLARPASARGVGKSEYKLRARPIASGMPWHAFSRSRSLNAER